MTLRGADRALVERAIEDADPLPGTAGFAGRIDDTLVRDVLGREPLFVERSVERGDGGPPADRGWAFAPSNLDDPVPFPAGGAWSADERRRVWTLPDPDPEPDRDRALNGLEAAIGTAIEAVRSTTAGDDGRSAGTDTEPRDLAVAFSGGVDSALVAELLDAPLYVAGFPGSHDVEAARTAADAMGRDLTVVELDHDDVERAVPDVARAIGRTNAMDVGIALPLYLVAERVAADGFDRLAVGQGADELFGGYEKVVRLDHRVEADTVRGAIRESVETLPDQLPRDVLALRAAGVEPVAPYLHDAIVDAALRLPTELLADEETRKRALRLIASRRLPTEVADREKKAVQYGSLVARELDRLARQAGYKRRIGDHVTKYVASLVDGSEGTDASAED